MARYRRPSIRLVFADAEFDGLEVDCKRLSNDRMFDLIEAAERMGDVDEKDVPGLRKALRELADHLAPCITSWNLDDEDGQPVPATGDGLFGQDPALLLAIADGIQKAMGGVADPLDGGSPNGSQPRALSDLTEAG